MKSPVIGLVVVACLASVSLSAEESTADAIRILNILPDYPVERGVKVELKVDVEASLESDYEGMSLNGFKVTI